MDDEKSKQKPGKIYVLIKTFQLITDDVEIFKTEEEADKAFKDYTGIKYPETEHEWEKLGNSDYDQTKIFETEGLK